MKTIAFDFEEFLHTEEVDLPSLKAFALEQHRVNGATVDETIRSLSEILKGDKELLAWMWDAMGVEIMALLLTPKIKSMTGTFSRPRTGMIPTPRPSWRDQLKHIPDGIWALIVPIGDTGRTKCLGDFDAQDITDVELAYRGAANRMIVRAEYCLRIRREMEPGDTLRKMAQDGRLRGDHFQFIDARLDDVREVLVLKEAEDHG